MSNDVTDARQDEQPEETPLASLGVIGALVRAMEEHQKRIIKPKKDAAVAPLINTFKETRQDSLVVTAGGEEVGRYKVNLHRDRFEIADEEEFEAYAEAKGEIDIVVTPKPAFVTASLKHAVRNPDTGTIFDSRTGDEIPGVKFVPGGQPTGTLTFTWKTFKGAPIGRDALLAAYRRHEFDELLQETPELLPPSQPGANS